MAFTNRRDRMHSRNVQVNLDPVRTFSLVGERAACMACVTWLLMGRPTHEIATAVEEGQTAGKRKGTDLEKVLGSALSRAGLHKRRGKHPGSETGNRSGRPDSLLPGKMRLRARHLALQR